MLSTQYSILYHRLAEIRRKVVSCEGMLREEFLPYHILPIPDDAPPEIPRVAMKTQFEHSVLQISLTGATLQTMYDDAYCKDWVLCRSYLKHRAQLTYSVIQRLMPKKVHMQGFVAQIILDEIDSDPVVFLRKNIQSLSDSASVRDIGYSACIVHRDRFFVNAHISNARIASESVPFGSPVRDADCTNQVLFNVEVNDNYSFNETPDYSSTEDTTDELLSVLSGIIESSLVKFVDTGVFELCRQ